MYYVITEDHKEYGRGLRFSFPLLHDATDDESDNDDVGFTGLQSLNEEEIAFCRDRSRCMSLLERNVIPVTGSVFGLVKKFRYKQGIRSQDYAVWTAQYYETYESSRSKKNVEMNFIELKSVLMQPIGL